MLCDVSGLATLGSSVCVFLGQSAAVYTASASGEWQQNTFVAWLQGQLAFMLKKYYRNSEQTQAGLLSMASGMSIMCFFMEDSSSDLWS